jgi:hypothetical protein
MALRLVTPIGERRHANVWLLPDHSVMLIKSDGKPGGPPPAPGARYLHTTDVTAVAETSDGYPVAGDCWVFQSEDGPRLAIKLTNAPCENWSWREDAAVVDTNGRHVYAPVYDKTGIVVVGQVQRERATIDLEVIEVVYTDTFDLNDLDALPPRPAAVHRFDVAPGAIDTAKGHRPVMAKDGTITLAKVNRAGI